MVIPKVIETPRIAAVARDGILPIRHRRRRGFTAHETKEGEAAGDDVV
jgi:hypothetical protein